MSVVKLVIEEEKNKNDSKSEFSEKSDQYQGLRQFVRGFKDQQIGVKFAASENRGLDRRHVSTSFLLK